MKVLMLNPPFMPKYSRQSRSPCVTKGGTFYYPYFLAYATGVLDDERHDVRLVDAVANGWGREETVRFAKEFGPGLIVVDTSTPSIRNDSEVAALLKAAVPSAHVTLVGTHPTALPEETLKAGGADSVCRGEYDYTVRDLARALASGSLLDRVEGISFKRDGAVVHNRPRPPIEDIGAVPWVSKVYAKHFGERGIRKYFYASLRWPQLTLLTARGCPYSCSFCNSPFKHSYRARPVADVVAELRWIEENLPFVKELMLEDETFPAVKQRTLELCKAMSDAGTKLTWSCNARVNTDTETLAAMKGAGCRLMCVGFESPEQGILDNVGKRTTAQMQEEFMRNSRKAGLLVNGCWILGLPGDTKESVKRTIEFAKKLNPDTAQIYSLYAYPGTAAWEWAEKNGHLTSREYSALLTADGQHASNVSIPGLSNREADELCVKALKDFYIRPRYIVKKLGQSVTNPGEAKRTAMAAKTFMKYLAGRKRQKTTS